jgi:hypothetical protein
MKDLQQESARLIIIRRLLLATEALDAAAESMEIYENSEENDKQFLAVLTDDIFAMIKRYDPEVEDPKEELRKGTMARAKQTS